MCANEEGSPDSGPATAVSAYVRCKAASPLAAQLKSKSHCSANGRFQEIEILR